MEANLSMVIDQVGRDKNIDRTVLLQALEQAILTAAKRAFGMNREMEAKYNLETGSVDLFLIINVVEDDAIEGREITTEDAHKYGLEAELGDELLFQIFYRPEDAERASEQDAKFGDVIDLKAAHKKFGRIAAQTAKQVISQRVREAERDNVYNEYKDRKGELITGIARRFERGNIIVDLGRVEAILPLREQTPARRTAPAIGCKPSSSTCSAAARGRRSSSPAPTSACSSSSSRWKSPRSMRGSSASSPRPGSRAVARRSRSAAGTPTSIRSAPASG